MGTVKKEAHQQIPITAITLPLTSKNNLEADQITHIVTVNSDILYQDWEAGW